MGYGHRMENRRLKDAIRFYGVKGDQPVHALVSVLEMFSPSHPAHGPLVEAIFAIRDDPEMQEPSS